ncbi:protein phosphatase CheZ [Parasulfuritortus cantonensis]|uniref:Protein phosphatase CheZ n=1 Tax=Parasulfuritortus cantonensis TaxID=2528202 RepID=A0A4R1B5L5_9PROT|nr:protein phosphatase CheZ [Parasulfuritortus cantonensis]TCJ13432.1 protein phosphatase CheZ [Parasulfuritortus cantonensis]
MTSDTPELEALFDSIAYAPEPEPAAPEPSSGDTPDLEALFDSIAQAMTEGGEDGAGAAGAEKVFARLGQMTRGLHDLLRELGLDQTIAKFANELPDNRDRLNYIAAMTAQAAEKTLNAAEAAKPIQEVISREAGDLAGKWDRMLAKQLGVAEFKDLVRDTHRYLHAVPDQSEAVNAKLMEIIMAQDFQDLTGQVIKKVLDAAQKLEKQLVALLIETTPEDKRSAVRPDLLEGPVINAAGRSDVVTSQEQVDELLESLGF